MTAEEQVSSLLLGLGPPKMYLGHLVFFWRYHRYTPPVYDRIIPYHSTLLSVGEASGYSGETVLYFIFYCPAIIIDSAPVVQKRKQYPSLPLAITAMLLLWKTLVGRRPRHSAPQIYRRRCDGQIERRYLGRVRQLQRHTKQPEHYKQLGSSGWNAEAVLCPRVYIR